MVDFAILKAAFRAEIENPNVDQCELLGAIEEMRGELFDRIDRGPTRIDNGGPITLRSEDFGL